ncbi:MAG: MarR family winged helix-turn-helix transcriptional regulator [Streptosporangiaceae bacterium]
MELPTADQLAIAHELERVSLWARRGMQARMSSTSITTLDSLEHSGPLRITDLADLQGVTQPGMTTLVNRLAADGYAERFPDPTDGRATLVRITPAGRQVLAERHAARSAAISAAISQLPAEHQHALSYAAEALRALTQIPPSYEKGTP